MARWVLRSFLLSAMRTEKQLSSPQPSAPGNYAECAARSLYSAIQGRGHACWDCEGGPPALTDAG